MKVPPTIKEQHQKKINQIYAKELKKKQKEATKKRLEEFFTKYGMNKDKKK